MATFWENWTIFLLSGHTDYNTVASYKRYISIQVDCSYQSNKFRSKVYKIGVTGRLSNWRVTMTFITLIRFAQIECGGLRSV